MKPISIIKSSGKREQYDEQKLVRSLQRAGAPSDVVGEIVADLRDELQDGMRTADIYRRAFALLRKAHRPTAARYNLKRAIMALGPSGHPFEHLVGEIFSSQGYRVRVSEMMPGACVMHEVDVLAERDDERLLVECKFHHEPGAQSDVKVALYVQARFEDIEKRLNGQSNSDSIHNQPWLVTNTRLTDDAIQYARCVGLRAVGWSYPEERNLQQLIERAGLHPLTCLTSLSTYQKQLLLGRGIVLCKDVLKRPELLVEAGITGNKQQRVFAELEEVCGTAELRSH